MNDVVQTQESTKSGKFKNQYASILGLDENIYYGKIDGSEIVNKYYVAKGTIFLPKQQENTEITYKELIAPNGFYLNSSPYVVNVGEDYMVDRIENYRVNYMIIPKTGIE